MTTKIANILQCYALGMEIKQISRSFELSRNTVRRYVRLFQKCGIPIKELASMPSSRIQEMFSEGVSRSQIPSQRQLELEALPPEYSARLSRRGVTVKSLYKEYHKTRPNGYKHASFGNYLMRYRMVTHVVGHIEHYADDQIYIDFASDKFEVIDNENGEGKEGKKTRTRPNAYKTVNAVALKCLCPYSPVATIPIVRRSGPSQNKI